VIKIINPEFTVEFLVNVKKFFSISIFTMQQQSQSVFQPQRDSRACFVIFVLPKGQTILQNK